MTTGKTDSLLSRLQSLTEGSREIDAEIALAIGWRRRPISERDHHGSWIKPDGVFDRGPPRFTESLDAALPLVPEGWTVGIHSDCRGLWFAEMRQCGVGTHINWPDGGEARAVNGAIALLIAIMKATEESTP